MQNDRKHVFRVSLVDLDISVSTSGRFYTHFLVGVVFQTVLSLMGDAKVSNKQTLNRVNN